MWTDGARLLRLHLRRTTSDEVWEFTPLAGQGESEPDRSVLEWLTSQSVVHTPLLHAREALQGAGPTPPASRVCAARVRGQGSLLAESCGPVGAHVDVGRGDDAPDEDRTL